MDGQMVPAKNSDTLIIQAFVNQTTPVWIQRCLDSVWKWAGIHGYAANLCLSFIDRIKKDVVWSMDKLEFGLGDIIKKYVSETGVHLVPYDEDAQLKRLYFA
jgi:hypothetical protein